MRKVKKDRIRAIWLSLSGREWTMAGLNHAKTLPETARVHNRCVLSNFELKLEFASTFRLERPHIYPNHISKFTYNYIFLNARCIKNVWMKLTNQEKYNFFEFTNKFLTRVFIARRWKLISPRKSRQYKWRRREITSIFLYRYYTVIPAEIIFENAIRLSRGDGIKMPVAGRIARVFRRFLEKFPVHEAQLVTRLCGTRGRNDPARCYFMTRTREHGGPRTSGMVLGSHGKRRFDA